MLDGRPSQGTLVVLRLASEVVDTYMGSTLPKRWQQVSILFALRCVAFHSHSHSCLTLLPQGGEGGGHTGHVPTSILIPACVVSIPGFTQ